MALSAGARRRSAAEHAVPLIDLANFLLQQAPLPAQRREFTCCRTRKETLSTQSLAAFRLARR